MKIYYSFPLQQLATYHKKYQSVIKLLKKDHTLTREWLDDAMDRMIANEPQMARADMYTDIMEAIKNADVCIFDISVKSMSIGHQISYALERRKPTLIISDIRISDPVDSLMIAGSKSGYLYTKDYNSETRMLKYIQQFLKKKDILTPPLRYNLFLEKTLSDYVDWKAFYYSSTKTDVIAEAIYNSMKMDEMYARYQRSKDEV